MAAEVRCLAPAGGECPPQAFVYDAADTVAAPAGAAGIIVADGPLSRAEALLAAGAPLVLLGEAALLDGEAVARLSASFGAGRVGVYVPARRMEVSWSFDTTSNADFRVVAPSLCEPAWEVLRADGGGTGTFAGWWIGQMLARGAALALVRVDIDDDADLNICAGLVEELGDRLWLGPLHDQEPKLDEWTTWGRLARLALPPGQYVRHLAALEAALPEAA